MQILVLGGTKFFGKSIVDRLVSEGHAVTTFSRAPQRPAGMASGPHICADRGDLAALKRVAESQTWNVVIDQIAFHGREVASTLALFPNLDRYVLTSTVSVYRFVRKRFPQPLSEDLVDYDYVPPQENPLDKHWAYARGKLETEKTLVQQSRVPWTIVRPPVVYGPYDPTDRGFWYLARVMDGGPLLLPSGGVQSFRLAYREDIAALYPRILLEPKTIGQAYHWAQSEILTLKDFIDSSAEWLGAKPNYVEAPLSQLGETLGGPWGPMVNFVPDNSKVTRDLGLTPTPWESFGKQTALWYAEHRAEIDARVLQSRAQEKAFAAGQSLRAQRSNPDGPS